jgi:hypothetical protein
VYQSPKKEFTGERKRKKTVRLLLYVVFLVLKNEMENSDDLLNYRMMVVQNDLMKLVMKND